MILCMFFSMTATAHAGVLERTYSGAFDDDWSLSAVDTVFTTGSYFTVRLAYGFNTLLINEDCATSYCNGTSHHASVYNANGLHEGPEKYANEYSDIQVRHSGAVVTYASVYDY